MTSQTAPLMSVEQFLALPDDGIDRELINGRVRTYGPAILRRTFRHARIAAMITSILHMWLERQPQPRGEIVTGNAGVNLGGGRQTSVGIDVAYLSAETVAANSEDAAVIDGVP